MTALILDAALLAADRDDRAVMARLRAAQQHGLELRTNAVVVARAWRDPRGRQANLARLLNGTDVRAITQQDGRQAGALLSTAGTSDPIDATVALLAADGDRIMTSDPEDIACLTQAAGIRAIIIPC